MARKKYRRRKKQRGPDIIGELTWILWRMISWPFRAFSYGLYQAIWRRLRPQTKGIPSVTLKGEKVKSKAEKRISDYLYQNGIKYKYEKPVRVWFGTKKLYPDFYLPKYKVYIEYFGMMDNKKYRKSAEWKMRMYKKSRIKVRTLDNSHYNALEYNLGKIIKALES